MGELPKQWWAWLARLLPQQRVRGDHAVQVGKVQGGMHADHSTHSSAVQVVQHVTHQHFYASAPAPVRQVPAAAPPAAATDGARQPPRPSEVLGLLSRLERPTYYRVLDFMRAEFGTAMVKELSGPQLYRLHRYAQTVERNEERESA